MKKNLMVGETQNAVESLMSVNPNIIALRNTKYYVTPKANVEKVCAVMNDVFDSIIKTLIETIENIEGYDTTFDNFEAHFRDLFEKDMLMKVEDVFSESDYNGIIQYLVRVCEQLSINFELEYDEEPIVFFEYENLKEKRMCNDTMRCYIKRYFGSKIPTQKDDVTYNAVIYTASVFIAQRACGNE